MSVNLPASGLEAIIRKRIDDAGGLLPFDRFMAAALYEPGLGYYESAAVFGREGDFVTGAELGPWLALGFADLIRWGWEQLGAPRQWVLVEQGGGSGRLLADVAAHLDAWGVAMPDLIAIEKSAQMRQRQQQLYGDRGLSVKSVATVAEAGELENALMFCNELPDAFPVRCFKWRGGPDGKLIERGVAHSDDRFIWKDGGPIPENIGVDESLMHQWPEGYISEWNPNLPAWLSDVAGIIRRGMLFCVDYGYSQQEYYRPQRIEGTLMGHRGHRVVENVLEAPGSSDITAHIDFTTLRRAGAEAGMRATCFMNQGAWLAQSPSVQQCVQELAVAGDAASMEKLAHAKRMLMPFGLGEVFKLLVQHINLGGDAPAYLNQFDRLDDLKLRKGLA